MKKHVTTGEALKIRKLCDAGVTDMETIQTIVFSDASVIQPFIDKYTKKAPAKKKGAAAAAAALDDLK